MDNDFVEERLKQDAEDLENSSKIDKGRIIYENINSMLDTYPGMGAAIMKKELKREINKYGKQNVLEALADLPKGTISDIQAVIYYEDDASEIHHSMSLFAEAMVGTLRTADEAKQLGDLMDQTTSYKLPE